MGLYIGKVLWTPGFNNDIDRGSKIELLRINSRKEEEFCFYN